MDLSTLRERQAWTLSQKIDHSLGTIDQFYSYYNGKVFVSFSGGKDSTVLAKLARIIDPNIKCVFVNTGCEYPDIVRFVNECKEDGMNVDILRPEMTPRHVWEKYGFPIGSKEIAEMVESIRRNPNNIKSKNALGVNNSHSVFQLNKRYYYLIHERYNTSNKCCDILKKKPSHRYEKETGLHPIIGTLADESKLREKTYLRRGGCNVFKERPSSHPLSIWMEKDIWDFIKMYDIKLADIYYKGVMRTGCVACDFGCQFRNDRRLEILYSQYPKYYQMIMSFMNNGVTYREAIRKLIAISGKALPDEDTQLTLF